MTSDDSVSITTSSSAPPTSVSEEELTFISGEISPNIVGGTGDQLTFTWEGSLGDIETLRIYHVSATKGMVEDNTIGWSDGPSLAIGDYPVPTGRDYIVWNLPDMTGHLVLIRIVALTDLGDELILHMESIYVGGSDNVTESFFIDDEGEQKLHVWRFNSLDPKNNYHDTISEWDSSSEVLAWCSTSIPIRDGNSMAKWWELNAISLPVILERPDVPTLEVLEVVSPEAPIRPDGGFFAFFDFLSAVNDSEATYANLHAAETGTEVWDALRAASFNCLGWTTAQSDDPNDWEIDGMTPFSQAGVEALLDRTDAEELMALPWHGHDQVFTGSFGTGVCTDSAFSAAYILIATPDHAADLRSRCGNQIYGEESCVQVTIFPYHIGGAEVCERFAFDDGFSDRTWFLEMVNAHRRALVTGDAVSIIVWGVMTFIDGLTPVPLVALFKMSVKKVVGLTAAQVLRSSTKAMDNMVLTFGDDALETTRYRLLESAKEGGAFRTAISSTSSRADSNLDKIVVSIARIDDRFRLIAKSEKAAGKITNEADRIAELYEQACLETRKGYLKPNHCTTMLYSHGILSKGLSGTAFDSGAIGTLHGVKGEIQAASHFVIPDACFSECLKNVIGTYSLGQPDLVLKGQKGRLLAGLGGDALPEGAVFTGHVKDAKAIGLLDSKVRQGMLQSAENGHAASLICTNPDGFSDCSALVRQLALDNPSKASKFSVTKIDANGVSMKFFNPESAWRHVDIDPRGTISLRISGYARDAIHPSSVSVSCSCSDSPTLHLDINSGTNSWVLPWGMVFLEDGRLTFVTPTMYSTLEVSVTESDGHSVNSTLDVLAEGLSIADYVANTEMTFTDDMVEIGDGTEISLTLSQDNCIIGVNHSICMQTTSLDDDESEDSGMFENTSDSVEDTPTEPTPTEGTSPQTPSNGGGGGTISHDSGSSDEDTDQQTVPGFESWLLMLAMLFSAMLISRNRQDSCKNQ